MKRVGDLPKSETCTHPEHRPPMHISLRDGIYEHRCPGCGHVDRFTVRNPRLS